MIEQALHTSSFPQKRIWQLYNNGMAFYAQCAVRITGGLDEERLRSALGRVVACYELLRTNYAAAETDAAAGMVPDNEGLEFVRLSVNELLPSWVSEVLAGRPVSDVTLFAGGTRLRVALLEGADLSRTMILLLPSTVADTVSLQCIIAAIAAAYATGGLPEEALPYSRYCEWKNDLLARPDEDALEFWSGYDYEAGSRLRLSYQRNAAIDSGLNWNVATFSLNKAETALLKNLSVNDGRAAPGVLLAALNVLLYKYTGSEQVVVGYINNQRGYEELAGAIGPIASRLPVATAIYNEDTFQALTDAVERTCEEVSGWEDYFPADEAVWLEIARQGRTWLPVEFEYCRVDHVIPVTDDVRFSVETMICNTDYFHLKLQCRDHGDHLDFSLIYDTRLFSGDEAGLLMRYYGHLLRQALHDPAVTIADMEMAGKEEILRTIAGFNTAQLEVPHRNNFISLFEEQAARTPDAPAVVSGSVSLSYRELDQKANQLAHHLRARYGLRPGTVAGVMLRRTERMIIGLVAILKSGAAYLPVDIQLPAARKQFMLSEAAISVLLTDSEFMFDIDGAFMDKLFVMDIQVPALTEGTDAPVCLNKNGDPAYIIYTSGSTGAPKGVVISHFSLTNYVTWFNDTFDISGSDSTLLFSSVAFDLCYTSLWTSLSAGSRLFLMEETTYLDPKELLQKIRECEATFLKMTPTHFSMLLQDEELAGDTAYRCLRLIVLGGEEIKLDDVAEFIRHQPDTVFVNHYGPTETTIGTIFHRIGKDDITGCRRYQAIGRPVSNNQVYILDPAGNRLLPAGIAGEICISGNGLAIGYLGDEDLTRRRFIAHPFEQGGRLYRTGDLGRWLPDGTIQFLGRKDDQLKIRGYRIEPGEIGAVLEKHEDIREAVVQAFNRNGDITLVAYFVSGRPVTPSSLRAHLLNYLPAYMLPASFINLARIPLTANGKINRKALPDPEDDPSAGSGVTYVAPSTDLERKLAAIWEKVLVRQPIGIHDNFFEAGGHSLRAVQILSRIHKELDAKIDLRSIFDFPTIALLAGVIDAAEKTAYEVIQPVGKKEYYDLSHAQKRLWILSQIEENHTAYNRLTGYVFRGKLDRHAFERAFSVLIERHESLRTTFITVEGEPRQKVHDHGSFVCPVEYFDLDAVPGGQEKVALIANEELERPFDLENGPLLRMKLFYLGSETYVFLFNIHHIISDGWTIKVMVNELLVLYQAFSGGLENPLKPLRIQYKDYAYWQNQQLNDGAISRHRNFWLEQFKGDIPVLKLSTDHPRPAIKTYNGSVAGILVEKPLADALNELSRQHGASLFMSLLAVLNTLLYRYTGQEDIVIGSPVAGRDHGDLEDQVGFYVNTLALRNSFDGNKGFGVLLEQVKQTTLQAYEHQVYPYDKLVDDLVLNRDRSRTPLFDVNLVLYNTDVVSGEDIAIPSGMQSVAVDTYKTAFRVSRYDLLFHCAEQEDGLSVNIEYNTDLFTARRIERMLEHFRSIVAAVTGNTEQPLSRIDYIMPDEKQLLLSGLHPAVRPEYLDKTLHRLFEAQAERTPELPAIVTAGGVITYGELNERSGRLAAFLHRTGFARQDVAAVMLDNSEHTVIAMLGVLKAGGAFLPLDPAYPYERLKYILADAGAGMLISEQSFIGLINKLQWDCPSLRSYLCIDSDNVYEAAETLNELMKEELWDYVGANAEDEIAGGGWVSSYTGEKMSSAEMAEYAENVLNKVRPFITPGSRVLEIGCASGISMLGIAPLVKEYLGTDLSARVLEIAAREAERKGIRNISLRHLAAHDIDQAGEGFDIVIINSVIQSFNGFNYLRRVLDKVIHLLADEAVIFIGDIQDLELKDDLVNSLTEFKRRHADRNYRTKVDWSSELFVPRRFFDDLGAEYSEISAVTHSAKTGTIANELTRFRYDTIIRINKQSQDERKGAMQKSKQQYGLNDLLATPADSINAGADPADLAYIIYTSGSTGRPKGVAVTHNSISNYVQCAIDAYFHGGSHGNMALLTTAAFDLTLTSIFCPVVAGKQLFISSGGDMNELLTQALSNPEVDTVKLTPAHISLLNYLSIIYTGIQQVIAGGEALKQQHVDILRSFNRDIRIYNEYGPTENTVGCTMAPIADDYLGIGKPVANTRIYILDDNGELLPFGHVGEICTGGYCLAAGYRNNPELTAERFIPDPFEAGGRLYRTGDLGRWREDGNLELIGRKDDQVKIRGYRIELGEIERFLHQHPEVVNCAVLVREDEGEADGLTAYVVCRNDTDQEELKAYLRRYLPDHMVPSVFIRLEELPLTANGKINRKALPRPEEINTNHLADYIPAATAIEKQLAEIWQDILKKERIGTADNFFDLGGHSLKATQVLTRIYKDLNAVVTLGALFTHPTIKELSELILNSGFTEYAAIQPVPEQAYYEASHAQKRLWVIDQLEEKQVAYNMSGAKVLNGRIDRAAFEKSFATLVQRHEILRTTFVEIDGELKQKIHDVDSYPFKVAYVDLRADEQRAETARSITDLEAQSPFDLVNGPLLRVKLLQLEDERYVFLFTLHHIISDGWSMNILIREALALYEAFRKGWKNPLYPLRIQYKDYTSWQNRQLGDQGTESLRRYWTDNFKGKIPVLNLPTDWPRPVIKTYNGDTVSFILSKQMSDGLQELGRKSGGSLFMVLISSVSALFHQYTGQEDMIFGAPIAGRDHKDLEEQVGLYANTLPIRVRFSGSESFSRLLEIVRVAAVDAYAHSLYPFDRLVEDLKLTRDPGRSPLFDVMLVQQHATLNEDNEGDMSGIAVERYRMGPAASKFDLSFYFVELNDGILIKIRYNKDLFKEERIALMRQELTTLLAAVLEDQEQAVHAINIAAAPEEAFFSEDAPGSDIDFEFSF